QFEPHDRPQSFETLADLLGPGASAPRRQLATLLAGTARSTQRVQLSLRVQKKLQNVASGAIAAAVCLCLVIAAIWPLWRGHNSQAKNRVMAQARIASPPIISLVAAPTHPALGGSNVSDITNDGAVRQANYQADDPI